MQRKIEVSRQTQSEKVPADIATLLVLPSPDARSASCAARRAPWCSPASPHPMPRRRHAPRVPSCLSCPPGAPSSTPKESWPTWSAKRGSYPPSLERTPLTKELAPRARGRARGPPAGGTPCASVATATETTRTSVRLPPLTARSKDVLSVLGCVLCGRSSLSFLLIAYQVIERQFFFIFLVCDFCDVMGCYK